MLRRAQDAAHRRSLLSSAKTPFSRTAVSSALVPKDELGMGVVKLETVHVGGHILDSPVVWLPREGVLFPGDLIFDGRFPNATR
jgi:glyoxylase-like metal-dependent hydrolase (beta-lactamase superfamily II)